MLNQNAIKKIILEDDLLKIEYLNKNGNIEDVVFVSQELPDLFDVEYFLLNIVTGYHGDQFPFDGLQEFAKALYAQLCLKIKMGSVANTQIG